MMMESTPRLQAPPPKLHLPSEISEIVPISQNDPLTVSMEFEAKEEVKKLQAKIEDLKTEIEGLNLQLEKEKAQHKHKVYIISY